MARPLKASWVWPSSCIGELTVAGTGWQAVHVTGDDRPDVAFRCDWCAPTDTRVVSLRPAVSTGGAGLSMLPWQEVQLPDVCTIPSMCFSGCTMVRPGPAVSVWQASQFDATGWPSAGGRAWQAPHSAWVPSTFVQAGRVREPPDSVVPWQ